MFEILFIITLGIYFRTIRWLIVKMFDIPIKANEKVPEYDAYNYRCVVNVLSLVISVIAYIPLINTVIKTFF